MSQGRATPPLVAAIAQALAKPVHSRLGQKGCDIEGTPFWLECHSKQLVNVRTALDNALHDTDGRPVVIVAKDNRPPEPWLASRPLPYPFVVMRLDHWLELVAR